MPALLSGDFHRTVIIQQMSFHYPCSFYLQKVSFGSFTGLLMS